MFTALPTWMNSYDAQRVMSYQVYEQIYWNVPDTFKISQRGSDAQPIYIPTGRMLVDTTHRYIGCNMGVLPDPTFGTTADQEALKQAFVSLFRREKFWTKYNSNKRFGLVRGDWLFHIIGNDLKPAGTRLKLETIDPAAYFPVFHPDDPDRIIGCHIVEQIETEDGIKIKRQTYQKGADPVNNDGSDTTIYNSIQTFNLDSWETFDAKPVTTIKPLTALHPLVKALPVYHIKNIETPGDPFGSSELRGFERIMAAINQAISDEELALALEGIGAYWTDSGTPESGFWDLGPGRVVQVGAGKKFNRVDGVNNVTAPLEHIKFLINALKEGSGVPDIAVGKVEVSNVSGVSLLLQMGPMLSKADERDDIIAGTMDQMMFDISTMWLPGYEQETISAVMVTAFGDRLPTDRKAALDEIVAIAGIPGAVDGNWVRTELAKLGFAFGDGIADAAMNEMVARARALDPFSTRLGQEEEQGGPVE